MNQESLYYSSSGLPLNNPQFHNLYRMQSPPEAWQNSYAPDNIGGLPNMGSSGAPCLEQPLVTPVSTAMYGTTATCSWAHTVPSLMPWVPTNNEASVVRFSAPFHPDPCTSQTATSWELMHNDPSLTSHHFNLKRKTDLEEPEYTPQKMCITEEKMAARLRDLHISNQFTIPSESGTTSAPVNKSPTNLQQLEIMLQESDPSGSGSSKSLILAPEVKKLVEPEKILNTFLNKIEKPSMALVVWQPPENKLLRKNEGNGSDVAKHNNNNLTPQQLSMMCQQYLSSQGQQGESSQTLPEDIMEV